MKLVTVLTKHRDWRAFQATTNLPVYKASVEGIGILFGNVFSLRTGVKLPLAELFK